MLRNRRAGIPQEGKQILPEKSLIPILLLSLVLGSLGLNWGLPGRLRLERTLTPEQRTRPFAEQTAKALESLYKFYDTPYLALAACHQPLNEAGSRIAQTPLTSNGRFSPSRGIPNHVELHYSYCSHLLFSADHDEMLVLFSIWKFFSHSGSWNPKIFIHGGAYIYPLAAFIYTASATGIIVAYENIAGYMLHPEETAKIYLLGRAFSVLGYLFCVFLLFQIATLLFNTRAGFLAAILFAVSPVSIAQAHIQKPHFWTAAWCLAAFYFMVRALKKSNRGAFYFSHIFLGLAIGTGLHAMLFALAGPLGCLLWRGHSRNGFIRIADWLLGFALAILVYLVSNPFVLFSLENFFAGLSINLECNPFNPGFSNLKCFLCNVLGQGLGVPTTAALIVALVMGFIRPRTVQQWLAVFVAATAFLSSVFFGRLGPEGLRFFLAPYGLWIVLLFGVATTSRVRDFRLRSWQGLCAVSLIIWNLCFGSLLAVRFFMASGPGTNEARASQWIRENCAPGGSIGMIQPIPTADAFPAFWFTEFELVDIRGHWPAGRGDLPDYVVLNPRSPWPKPRSLAKHYRMEATFERKLFGFLPFRDPFTNADFTVLIYRRISMS